MADLLEIGIDEDRNGDPGVEELPDHFLQVRRMQYDVQSTFGRQLVALLRDERHLVGLDRLGYANHLRVRCHLDIEMC